MLENLGSCADRSFYTIPKKEYHYMKSYRLALFVMAAVLLLALGAMLAQSRGASIAEGAGAMSITGSSVSLTPSPEPGHQAPEPNPVGPTTWATGISAIPVSNPAVPANIPAFTEADVRNYNSLHHAHGLAMVPSLVAPTVVQVTFLTNQALRARAPGLAASVPDNRLMCYVKYQGAFVSSTSPGTTVPYVVEIFDAHTGNLMSVGLDPADR
jgi:hypothetical protein